MADRSLGIKAIRRKPVDSSEYAPSREARDVWVELMDPKRTSVREFLESYKIPTKRTQANGTNMMPYRMWEAQVQIHDTMMDFWNRGEGAKIVVVKDRQRGITSGVGGGFMWERFCRGGGGFGRSVSKDNDATEDIMRVLAAFKLQTPGWVMSDVLGGEWVSDRPDALELRRGPSITRLETMAARDGAMGRGASPRWMHVSEYPWWQTGKGNLGAALEAWEDAPGNFVIIESTGKDFDEFYELCMSAHEGRSPYKLLFFPWIGNVTKTYTFPSRSERDDFERTVGRSSRYGEKEEQELVALGATLEQLAWRRRKIDSPDTPGGSLTHFAREHPTKLADCFLAEALGYFQPLSNVVDRVKKLEAQEDKAVQGRFETEDVKGGGLKWVPARHDGWTMYAKPVPGRSYCFGSDPSGGRRLTDRGRRETDFGVLEIRDVETEEIMAVFRAHEVPERLAVQIMCGSKFYGWARGYVERNADGRVVIRELEQLMDAWDCPEDILLRQRKLVSTKNGDVWDETPGFYTDSKSKPQVVNHLRRMTREMGPVSAPTDKGRRLLYLGLAEEMMRFVNFQALDSRGMPKGQPKLMAETGHDDRVMAAAMCLEARSWLYERPSERTVFGAEKKALTFEEYNRKLIDAAMSGRKERQERGFAELGSEYA